MYPWKGWRSLHYCCIISGLLGSVTQTANVDSCPGKCIHSLASLICDDVREEVECPSPNMRCCVEKGAQLPPPSNDGDTEKIDKSSESSKENEVFFLSKAHFDFFLLCRSVLQLKTKVSFYLYLYFLQVKRV